MTRNAKTPILIAMAAALLMAAGCTGGRTVGATYTVATGGTAARGARLVVDKNCGSCHTIPGIRTANGLVGPPLMFFGRRTYIAGELPNTPGNLVHWLQSPQSVEPGTAMPNLGLSEQEARDVAAYLYTLR